MYGPFLRTRLLYSLSYPSNIPHTTSIYGSWMNPLGFLFSLLVWWDCLSWHMLHSCLIIKFWLCIPSKLSLQVYISVCEYLSPTKPEGCEGAVNCKIKRQLWSAFSLFDILYNVLHPLGIYSHRDQWIRKHWAHFTTKIKVYIVSIYNLNGHII